MAYQLKSNWPNGMAGGVFRYEPQSSAKGGPCGAGGGTGGINKGLNVWQKYFDARNLNPYKLVPGGDVRVRAKFTANHGGQVWMQIQCLPDDGLFPTKAGWINMERAMSDRSRGFLPSNPEIYAWKNTASKADVYFTVPANFSCQHTQNRAIGRWLWKTGNSCNDFNNKKDFGSTTFKRSEYLAAGGSSLGACDGPPAPPPPPPTPQPTPVPTPQPTPVPTPQPTPVW